MLAGIVGLEISSPLYLIWNLLTTFSHGTLSIEYVL
jgi:hypothetical protein